MQISCEKGKVNYSQKVHNEEEPKGEGERQKILETIKKRSRRDEY